MSRLFRHVEASTPGDLMERLGYSFNLKEDGRDDAWVAIGRSHPSAAALDLVRTTLSEFEIPAIPRYRFTRMHRTSGHEGAYDIDQGWIEIEAEFSTPKGHRIMMTVPVYVDSGKMLRPGIAVLASGPQVLAQTLFDDLLTQGAKDRNMQPDRPMYSPPGGGQGRGRVMDTRWNASRQPPATAFSPRAYAGPDPRDIRAAIQGTGLYVEAGPKDWAAAGAVALGLGMASPSEAHPEPAPQHVHLDQQQRRAPAAPPYTPPEYQQNPKLLKLFLEGWSAKPLDASTRSRVLAKSGASEDEMMAHYRGVSFRAQMDAGNKNLRDPATRSIVWQKGDVPPGKLPIKSGALGGATRLAGAASLGPGCKVALTQELRAMDVGGPSVTVLKKGKKGLVLRDWDGTGARFVVLFEDGTSGTVPAHACRKA